MRLKPATAVGKPAYPRQQAVTNDPELLSRLPLRWQRCRKAAVAAGLFGTLALSGCGIDLTPTPLAGAPLPPPLLTESEVKECIMSVAPGYHLALSGDTAEVKDALFVSHDSILPDSLYETAGTGEIDLYDPALKIGFDYFLQSEGQTPLPEWSGSPAPVSVEKGEPVVLVIRQAYDRESVRRQVTDFLDWLNSEGII